MHTPSFPQGEFQIFCSVAARPSLKNWIGTALTCEKTSFPSGPIKKAVLRNFVCEASRYSLPPAIKYLRLVAHHCMILAGTGPSKLYSLRTNNCASGDC